jgi:hypothetical protein
MKIAADTFCNVCAECPADCIYNAQPMCYLCRERSAKAMRNIDAIIKANIALCERVEREQEALLAVTREEIWHPPVCECADCSMPPPPDVIYAHGYMDDEQEAYYAGLNIPCTGYTEGCLCGGCTAETYRYSISIKGA